jgi:hypothetical protein
MASGNKYSNFSAVYIILTTKAPFGRAGGGFGSASVGVGNDSLILPPQNIMCKNWGENSGLWPVRSEDVIYNANCLRV